MGFKKLSEREKISGHHTAVDIEPGTYSVEALSKRNAARQEEINKKHVADWPKDMTSIVPEGSTPILADAMAKAPRPSDVSSHGVERYGVSGAAGVTKANPGATPNQGKPAPDSNSKVSK